MSGQDDELEQFLEVVRKLVPREPLAESDRVATLEQALTESDVLDLAVETAELDGARRWLAEVVRTVARSSPSLALVLAARYTAHRAMLSANVETDSGATAGLVAHLDVDDPASLVATVPGLFEPEITLLLDAAGTGGVLLGAEATTNEPSPKRTGLADAQLRTVRIAGNPILRLEPAAASAAVNDLTLLAAAAALGVAEAALAASTTYAADRRQFGSSLLAFTGLRAMLAEMQLRITAVAALLDQALDTGTTESCLELAATAGRAAVDVAIDAIQVHGGYGYIDEYPVAGLLRDALSLRARIPRRARLQQLAVERFGPVG